MCQALFQRNHIGAGKQYFRNESYGSDIVAIKIM